MYSYGREAVYLVASKLYGEWSAPKFSKILNQEFLSELVARYEIFDPMVRMRLLLACMCLPRATREELRPELEVGRESGPMLDLIEMI